MNFASNSFVFLFLPFVVMVYSILIKFNKGIENIFLVLASLLFYSWFDIKIAFVLFAISVIIWLIGKALEKNKTKNVLVIAVSSSILVLLCYKYSNFMINIVNRLLTKEYGSIYLVLPLGLSFFVFEIISYLVDVYRGENAGSLVDAVLFLLYFPKIASGPIVLWKDFNQQLKNKEYSFDNVTYGIERVILGLSKKIIIADTLSVVTSNIVNNLSNVDSLTLVLCLICFTIEIYYDFSGYSDIAIGLSYIFGIKITENFDYPYRSTSITEFWRRWHISLSNWFKEYVYIPLGGNRKSKKRTILNLAIVFLLTGIWHGNGAAYILWGIINGLFVCFERVVNNTKAYIKIPKILKWLLTMTVVSALWTVFMLPSFSDVIGFYRLVFSNIKTEVVSFSYEYYFDRRIIFIAIVGIFASIFNVKKALMFLNKTKGLLIIKYLLLIGIFALSIVFLVNSTYSPFIYFRY